MERIEINVSMDKDLLLFQINENGKTKIFWGIAFYSKMQVPSQSKLAFLRFREEKKIGESILWIFPQMCGYFPLLRKLQHVRMKSPNPCAALPAQGSNHGVYTSNCITRIFVLSLLHLARNRPLRPKARTDWTSAIQYI